MLTLSWQSGGQLVTGSSDGLVKVWWVVRQECTVTLDIGESKVWSVVTHDDQIVAGGDQGRLLVWMDNTEQQEAISQEEQDVSKALEASLRESSQSSRKKDSQNPHL